MLLSFDGSPPAVGDYWCVAAAAASAMFIMRLEGFAKEFNAAELNSVSFATGKNNDSIKSEILIYVA